jgi:hypothetical protein
MYFWLANLVVLLHALLVTCVVLGAAAAVTGRLRRYPRLERVFYLLLGAVIVSQLCVGDCVMTLWEKSLRNLYQPGSDYRESCIGHYLPWLPPFVLPWVGPALVISALLAFPFWRWQDRRNHPQPHR